ncbi:hypothetical protein WMW71_10150 [Flavobacterium buctense]|uniref:Uncharacterized protein n=1 Tax=Flavobacterium buctense TaxID=1648146 RepID=A0ABU9E216_9FLAO|nr:hypothetical protein [Flavobacterium buctense]
MSEQSDNQLSYYPLKLWTDSIITITIFFLITLLFVWNKHQPYGIILALIIWRVIWNHFYNTVKNLSRQLSGKPAIELTEEYFYDHINDIKIYWKNITQVNLWQSRGSTFVCFELKDLESHVKQSKSLIDKFLYKLKVYPEGVFVKTEISLVKGKNEEIFGKINRSLQYKSTHISSL